MHFLFSWNKQERIQLFWRNKKSFILKLFLVFSVKQRSRFLCCEKRIILVFVVLFMTWGNKFCKWNNQSGSWGISKGNREALLFMTYKMEEWNKSQQGQKQLDMLSLCKGIKVRIEFLVSLSKKSYPETTYDWKLMLLHAKAVWEMTNLHLLSSGFVLDIEKVALLYISYYSLTYDFDWERETRFSFQVMIFFSFSNIKFPNN